MPFCACVCPSAYAYALVKTMLKETGGSRNENVMTVMMMMTDHEVNLQFSPKVTTQK